MSKLDTVTGMVDLIPACLALFSMINSLIETMRGFILIHPINPILPVHRQMQTAYLSQLILNFNYEPVTVTHKHTFSKDNFYMLHPICQILLYWDGDNFEYAVLHYVSCRQFLLAF